MTLTRNVLFVITVFILSVIFLWAAPAVSSDIDWMTESVAALETELVAKHGDAQRRRVQRVLDQVADFWREEDGGRGEFEAFITRYFAGDEAALQVMFARYEKLLEQLDGHSLEILLAFREQSDLDVGPIMPYDDIPHV